MPSILQVPKTPTIAPRTSSKSIMSSLQLDDSNPSSTVQYASQETRMISTATVAASGDEIANTTDTAIKDPAEKTSAEVHEDDTCTLGTCTLDTCTLAGDGIFAGLQATTNVQVYLCDCKKPAEAVDGHRCPFCRQRRAAHRFVLVRLPGNSVCLQCNRLSVTHVFKCQYCQESTLGIEQEEMIWYRHEQCEVRHDRAEGGR